MKTLLHVGCGYRDIRDLPPIFQTGDWSEIRYDANAAAKPDIVGELQDMSWIEDGHADALYSSHCVEHVWAFEVPTVLSEFRRVLKPSGFAVILCPDMEQVARAILDGKLDQSIYTSPAGPISALDVMYGYQSDLAAGNGYMAHKTAFTSSTLANRLHEAGFPSVVVTRDNVFGLHAFAFPEVCSPDRASFVAGGANPGEQFIVETLGYGEFA